MIVTEEITRLLLVDEKNDIPNGGAHPRRERIQRLLDHLIAKAGFVMQGKHSNTHHPIRKAVAYLAIFTVGLVAISMWSFWRFIHPAKITAVRSPADVALPVERVQLETSDGLKLAAWYAGEPPGRDERRAIVFIHGYPADKSDLLDFAAPFYPEFSLLLFDLRYFGESQGRYTTLGLEEPQDLAAALDFLTRRGYERIGVFGFSLGGATALRRAAEDGRINALVTYAAFSDLRTLGEEAYAHLPGLNKILVSLMTLWAGLWFGQSVDDASPLAAAEGLKIPVLLVHTRGDEVIPFRHAERLARALGANPRARFLFLDRGQHGELDAALQSEIRKFFRENL